MAQMANLKPSRRRFWRSIQGELILLLLVLLIPILLLQAYAFYDRFETRRAEELQANLEIARSVADTFQAFIQDVLHQELAMGLAITSSQPMTSEDITRLLQQAQLGQSAVRDFSWVNRDGIFLYSSNPAMVGSNNSDRAYFRDITGGREWTVGELVLARTTGKPVFGVTRGIRDDQGALLGVVVATVIPEGLDAVLSFERSKGGAISIVDHKGMLVYRYPDINVTWEERNWVRQYPEYGDVFKGKEVAKTFYAYYEGKNRIASIVPITSIGWAAGAGRTEETAMNALTSRLLPEGTIFLLVTLAAFCAALGLSRFISTPVKRLQSNALALGHGAMDELALTSGPAEIKDLSDAFSMMAEEIRRREREIISLAENAQKRAAEAEEGKRIIEAIMDAVPAAILIAHDPECDFMTGNRTLYELLKMQPGSTLSKTAPESEQPMHFKVVRNGVEISPGRFLVEMAARGKEVRDCEFELMFNHGEPRHMFGTATPLISRQGEAYGSVAVFMDITDRKRAEQALQEAHERAAWLARFPEENPNPVVRVSADGNILYRNRVAGELPGWTCEVGMLLPDSLLPMIKEAMTEGEEAQQEVGLGGRLYSVSATPFPAERYANIYGTDITERKQMEEEICRARDDLEIRVQERTRELVMAEEAVQRANRALRTINACNEALIRDMEEQDLLNHVCEIIVQDGGYRMAWVGFAEQDEEKKVRPLAYAGYDEGYLETADISWADTERGRGPTGLAIREGKIHTGRNIQTQPNLGPWRAEALRRGYASSIALPLILNTRTYGALTIYASELDAFNEEETKLLASLADNLSYGIASIHTQIERERAEEKIAGANAMLETVFDGISDPLLMVEKDYRIRMLNEATCKYFHIVNREEAIAKTCYEVTVGGSEPCDNCVISSAILEGKKTTFERKGLFDPERIEQITVYPVDEAVSGVSGAIMRISDITESRNMEKHLIRTDRLSSLGQLSGGIAHEIRNPLAGINLFIDVLGDEEKFSRTSQEQDILEEIKTNIKKINGIIKRVLDFSRQSQTAPLSNVNANVLIKDSLKFWQSRMVKNRIQSKLFLRENLPDVLGDSIEIQQVLTNLIQNAVEAMEEEGTLSISTETATLSFDERSPAVIIKVQDSGPGIPLDQQKNIFNPFFTTKHTGTGLGLAISHRIVSRHRGLLSFESVPGEGTTFTVEFPVAPAG